MKYMTFNSSCSYAGLANLLSFQGIETEDRAIALQICLPYLFDREDGRYLSVPCNQILSASVPGSSLPPPSSRQ